jgi:prepilin-type N-terminal cleavage/methylation domain-containing protein
MNKGDLQNGFTLIEMLVVIAIIGIVSVFFLLNMGSSRVNLPAAAEQLVAEIRSIQTMATGSSRQGGVLRCGFGITPDSGDTGGYYAYAGPDASTVDCATIDHNFSSSEDTIHSRFEFSDKNLEFKDDGGGIIFKDVFFMPPDPKTYINDSATLGTSPARIIFGIQDVACATTHECRAICIYPSGLIQLSQELTCP